MNTHTLDSLQAVIASQVKIHQQYPNKNVKAPVGQISKTLWDADQIDGVDIWRAGNETQKSIILETGGIIESLLIFLGWWTKTEMSSI